MPPERTLTDADIAVLTSAMQTSHCNCPFNTEEVQFVKNWLDTAKTAKSETIKWGIKFLVIGFGLMCGAYVIVKTGWVKQ